MYGPEFNLFVVAHPNGEQALHSPALLAFALYLLLALARAAAVLRARALPLRNFVFTLALHFIRIRVLCIERCRRPYRTWPYQKGQRAKNADGHVASFILTWSYMSRPRNQRVLRYAVERSRS